MARSPGRNVTAIFSMAIVWISPIGCAVRHGAPPVASAAQPCPSWVEFPIDTGSNANSAYLGCINEVNITRMLECPDDLRYGRLLGPASGVRESLAVDAYNQGKTKLPSNTSSAIPTIVMPAGGGAGNP